MHVLSWREQNRKKQTRRRNHSKKIPRKAVHIYERVSEEGPVQGVPTSNDKNLVQELLR